jgi:hypothetical protein
MFKNQYNKNIYYLSLIDTGIYPVIAFLVTGGDPTAHTMSFLIYEIVGLLQVILANIILDLTNNLAIQLRHPDVLGRLRSEIDARIPCSIVIPSLDQIQLPYLNMVLKETLRYRSTGFGTFRTCLVDTEVFGVLLPANTTLALWNPAGQWHIHLQHFSPKNMKPMRMLIYESNSTSRS